MPISSVSHCIICEDFRPEKYNKLAILGFYGIETDVTINVKELGKGVERLMFLFACKGAEGSVMASANIINPDNTALATGNEILLPIGEKQETIFVGVVFAGVAFTQHG